MTHQHPLLSTERQVALSPPLLVEAAACLWAPLPVLLPLLVKATACLWAPLPVLLPLLRCRNMQQPLARALCPERVRQQWPEAIHDAQTAHKTMTEVLYCW